AAHHFVGRDRLWRTAEDVLNVEAPALARLSRLINDSLSVRHELPARMTEAVASDADGLPRTRGKQDELGRIGVDFRGQGPPSVGRESRHPSWTEERRGRSVRSSNVYGVAFTAPLARLEEENPPAVGREVADPGVIQPIQLALLLRARRQGPNAEMDVFASEQDAPIPRDVVQVQHRHQPGDRSLFSRERNRTQVVLAADFRGGEPDCVSAGCPGQTPGSRPGAAERPPAVRTDESDRAAVVAGERVVDEGDTSPVRRDPRVADPAHSLVENLS